MLIQTLKPRERNFVFTNYTALRQIPKNDKRIFRQVVEVAKLITIYEVSHETYPFYRCHSIARALAHHIPGLKVVDGCFAGIEKVHRKIRKKMKIDFAHYAHSWLTAPGG